MRKITMSLLGLALLAGIAGSALADVTPDVEVKLLSPFVAVKSGDTYKGQLEILCREEGTLSQFELASDGWSATLDRAPGSRSMKAGERVTVSFTARALDPNQRLEFTCDFQGHTIAFPIDLSERNFRNMTEGAPVKKLSEFQSPAGDPSWSETDRILGTAPTINRDPSKRTITVSGRFGCNLDGGGYLPAHSITVEVWDQDTDADDLMGTGSTNYDGYYSIAVNSADGDLFSDPDIYLRFILHNNRIRVYEPTSGNDYVFNTGVTQNYSGTNLEYGSLIPASPDLQACVFLHTQGTRAWVHDYNLGYDVPLARIEWPSAAWPNTSGDGRIQMRNDFSWSDGTLWHEYGHWFDHEIASWDPFNYCNGVCDNSATDCGHCVWCQESQSIAWLEGWANYHSYAVGAWYPGYYGLDPLAPMSAESLHTCGGSYDTPLLTEGFTFAVAQDITDSNQDSHGVYGSYTDALALGDAAVFALNALDNPTGSQDFLDKFAARYPTYREAFWETAANCGYWLDTQAPGTASNLVSTSHTAGVASPDPTASFTWNRASDNFSGIQGYHVTVTSGSHYLPSQVLNIGDVTSYTTNSLSPGTYYLNLRALDNAGYWSSNYVWWGPIVIREPDPADLVSYLHSGWDYPLVPRTTNDSTAGDATVPSTLPGDAALTYWNIFGQNQGEAGTGSSFYGYLNVDGEYTGSAYWGEIGAGGLYYGPNRGPVYVQAGRHSFTFRHDATDQVAEENELNNTSGHQFIWTPPTINADMLVARPSPPVNNGGWDELTSPGAWYNCDGLNMPTSGGYWHAMAVWADSDANDYDCRLYLPSTGAEDGFGSYLEYSTNGPGHLDAVITNRNVLSGASFDVGSIAYTGSGNYKAYHATSQILAFGDSVTVAMAADQPILLREFYLGSSHFGPVSVTAAGAPADGPLNLVVLDHTFDHGTLNSFNQVGNSVTDLHGLARVSADLNTTGWYGILVYRDQSDGLNPRDVTIEISTTPPDLAPWTPPGWYAAITPRPALDGTSTYCPQPDTLYSAPAATYLNVGATNLGPVASILPTRVYRDDSYQGYINWGSIGSGAQVRYNWASPFAYSAGRHVLSFRVDALNEVEETNEDNNIRGEQWIWSPVVMDPPAMVQRPAPPVNVAGWNDVTTGEPFYYNCDGLRLQGTGLGYWKALAILPADGSDFDLRLHQPGVGAKSGFGPALVGSYEAGTKTEYVLVDQNSVAFQNYDVGVTRWSGDGAYRAQAQNSTYLGAQPVGSWGPYSIPAEGLLSMAEFRFPPEVYEVTLENLSGADLDLAIHQYGTAYQNRLFAVALAEQNGPGLDETAQLDVSETAYHCLVVYRNDQSTEPASFRLHITNSLSAVGDDEIPPVTRLTGAYPNPFNPQTTVAFDLSRAGHVRVLIYDVNGRLIRRLVDENRPAGHSSAIWLGHDDNGHAMASGVYFARLETDSGQGMTKLVLVK